MSVFIGAESVVMNALIETNKMQDKQELIFEEVVRYGKAAARAYRRKTGEDAILLLSKADQISMMESYPQYFDVDAYVNHQLFRLRDNAPIDEIQELFQWLLSPDLLDAFLSPEAIACLQN